MAELVFSSKCFSQKDSHPAFQCHPAAPTLGPRHKSTFAQPINYYGSRTASPEQREICQTTQIARLQLARYPRARECLFRQLRPHAKTNSALVKYHKNVNGNFMVNLTHLSCVRIYLQTFYGCYVFKQTVFIVLRDTHNTHARHRSLSDRLCARLWRRLWRP